jgi:hypothetical protein
MIKFKAKMISYIDEHSGHFAPKNRVQYVLQELKDRNAVFYPSDLKPQVSQWKEVGKEARVRDNAEAERALQKILAKKNQK